MKKAQEKGEDAEEEEDEDEEDDGFAKDEL